MTTELSLDAAVAERMGSEGAVAAISFPFGRDEWIEVALVPPGKAAYDNADWLIVVHSGCNPDKPDYGTSSIEEVPGDQTDAERRYLEVIDEIKDDLQRKHQNYPPM